jgi:hypothetical protein
MEENLEKDSSYHSTAYSDLLQALCFAAAILTQ